jgi:HSP20 family protein
MATSDRSRQQSGEAQQGGATSRQQGGGQQERGQMQQRGTMPGGRGDLPATRGWYEPSLFGGVESGPFGLMRRLSEDMDRLFESFGMGGSLARGAGVAWPTGGEGLRQLWSPHIEVCERGDRLVIQADLPGVRKEDVNVQIENDQIVIQGERKQESTREEGGYFHTERSYGTFYRTVALPEGVDADQAKATFRDGVLEVELPVPQQRTRGRRLEIGDRLESGGTQPTGGSQPTGTQAGGGSQPSSQQGAASSQRGQTTG